ncbi:MAG: hypothetical protein Q8R82_12185 [Hyphomonadaceae bacterium]|nr:hypothetical protein [Hyphomonadaceae bacterium]
MGKASSAKRDRREGGLAATRRLTAGRAPKCPHAATTGFSFELFTDGRWFTGHQAVMNVMADDSPEMLQVFEAAANAAGGTILDLEFVARHADGEPYTASILWQAFGQQAHACLRWLVAYCAGRRNERAMDFVKKLFVEFNDLDPASPHWSRIRGGARAAVLGWTDREQKPGGLLAVMGALGGNIAALSSEVRFELDASAQSEELSSMLAPAPVARQRSRAL